MVDEVREKPPGSRGRPLPQERSGGIGTFQPEEEFCCRFAAGATGCHLADNHKSQERGSR
jgi:hypothetical protein